MLTNFDINSLSFNPFKVIGKQWMLITAGNEQKCNTMTASWGGLGVLWGTNVAACFVRPQRYTYEFIEKSPFFTLSFLGEAYRKALALCGSKSGRDVDKVKECGFTVAGAACGAPYFEEAELVLVCKKMYHQDFDPKGFCYERLSGLYANQDYHTMYVGEVVQALKKQ